jgi:adenosylcobinamide-GDP ribazoletransferase
MTPRPAKTPLHHVLLAFVLLSRLPLPQLPDAAFAKAPRAVWAYPLVGVVLSACAVAIGWVAMAAGASAMIASGVVIALLILLSGAMHEDGLADTADGFWGGHDAARRLEIMKDSQIGTYGVLALGISTGLRWTAIAALLPTAPLAVIASASLSRGVMPVVMTVLPLARSEGLSHSVGRPSLALAGLSVAFGVMLCILLTGAIALGLGLLALLVTSGIIAIARRKIGGQTGDVLGATQQLADVAMLVLLAMIYK